MDILDTHGDPKLGKWFMEVPNCFILCFISKIPVFLWQFQNEKLFRNLDVWRFGKAKFYRNHSDLLVGKFHKPIGIQIRLDV